MRKCAILFCAYLGMVVGCGPAVPEDDLGKVVFEIPDVPGSEVPYKLPSGAPPEPDETDSSEVPTSSDEEGTAGLSNGETDSGSATAPDNTQEPPSSKSGASEDTP